MVIVIKGEIAHANPNLQKSNILNSRTDYDNGVVHHASQTILGTSKERMER